MKLPSSKSSNKGLYESPKDMPNKSKYTMKWSIKTRKSTLKLEKVGVESKSV